MKKALFLTLTLLALPLVMFAAERMVFAELFTSTTCPPCVAGNAALDGILSEREDYLAVVRVHMSWPSPGNDPWYHYLKDDNNDRRFLYSINAVPTLVVDGSPQGSISSGPIDDRHGKESPLEMHIYRDFGAGALSQYQGEGSAMIIITNETNKASTFTLYGALTESDCQYTGTNGDAEHDQVMIDMIPDYNGTNVTLEAGEMQTFFFDFDTYDSVPVLDAMLQPTGDTLIANAENCELVFWCQLGSTNEVLQAAKVKVPGQKSLSLSNIKVYDASGDGVLGPSEEGDVGVTITNGSEEPVQNVRVFLEVDNEEVSVEKGSAVVAEIGAGESFTLEADSLAIKTSATYDGSTFNFVCRAGSDDGTMASYSQPLGVDESNPSPTIFSLSVPSMVKEDCRIRLSLGSPALASISLFDVAGRQVKTLYTNNLDAGDHLVSVPVSDLSGGVYFVKAKVGSDTRIEKILILQ